ncbi:MAG: Holliday junction resolvase [Nanoarchaeota archaeon]|nr:Holliday junction resolvase [Nanoarchaeota archaeon]
MSNKAKGSKAERELVRLFTEHGWRAVRVAGSGMHEDSPCDLIAGKKGKKGCTIEAKSSKKSRIYITKAQIEDFIVFSDMIGLKPVIAVRFNREGWLFLDPLKRHLEDSGKYWVVSLERARKKGKRFGQFF